jgi:hypothetical protein
MNFSVIRLGRGERILLTAAAVLFVALFFFKWFAVTVPRLFSAFVSVAGYSTSFTGWQTLTGTRWVLLLAILAALALVVLVGADVRIGWLSRNRMGAFVAALGGLATLLVFRRTIVDHPGGNGVHVKLGAYLGLLACALLTYGGYVVMSDGDPLGAESDASEDGEASPAGTAMDRDPASRVELP